MTLTARNRCADADYCPTCGQPREQSAEPLERAGLRLLANRDLCFNNERVHLPPSEAEFMRAILPRGSASHEFLILRIAPEADDQITRVYAHRLSRKLNRITGGAASLRSIYGWGYELIVADPLAVAA